MGIDTWQSWWTSWTPTAAEPQLFIEAVGRLLAAANTQGAASATQAFTDFLRDHYGTAGTPWQQFAPPFAAASAYAGDAQRFPAMGPAREYQERMQRLTEAARRCAEAQRRLQRLCSDLLSEAATAFAARVLAAAPADQNAETLGNLFDQWIDAVEEAYSRAACSESFCSALADSVNAMSEWRCDMQTNVEAWAKLFDLPTRSELDSLARRVRTLEAELHAARVGRKTAGSSKRRGARSTSKP